jgi:hypothetical protein
LKYKYFSNLLIYIVIISKEQFEESITGQLVINNISKKRKKLSINGNNERTKKKQKKEELFSKNQTKLDNYFIKNNISNNG